MSISYYFSEEDLVEIEDEVKKAEKDVSGEIVPVFMERSHHYPESIWRSVAIGMGFSGVLLIFVDMLLGWQELVLLRSHTVFLSSIIGGGLIMAGLAGYFPALRRRLTTRANMEEQVLARAERTFLEYELFKTRQRTGILIFISLFEHRVQVVGDKGISARVSADEWKQVVDQMVPFLKRRENKEAVVTGIRLCHDLLLKYGFNSGPDDRNELPDHLRQNLDA